jgi:hypothetical protein
MYINLYIYICTYMYTSAIVTQKYSCYLLSLSYRLCELRMALASIFDHTRCAWKCKQTRGYGFILTCTHARSASDSGGAWAQQTLACPFGCDTSSSSSFFVSSCCNACVNTRYRPTYIHGCIHIKIQTYVHTWLRDLVLTCWLPPSRAKLKLSSTRHRAPGMLTGVAAWCCSRGMDLWCTPMKSE